MGTNVGHPSIEPPPKRGYLRLEFISERSTRTILAGQVKRQSGKATPPLLCCTHRCLPRCCSDPPTPSVCCLQRLAGLAAFGVMAWEIAAQ